MRALLMFLAIGLATVVAVPRNTQRIVGGSETTIEQYPYGAVLLYSSNLVTYIHSCGGAILNIRSILSAAHCFIWDPPTMWRVRVGSTYASAGGVVHSVAQVITHPDFSMWTADNDVGILQTTSAILFDNLVTPGSIAGPNYNLADNQGVWAIGWGAIFANGPVSEVLRDVQVWTVNQATCRDRYAEIGRTVTDNMLCSGWLDVGGRDQCQGDSGGPLIHNGVIVGLCSWGESCALARYPGVNTRISRYTSWIQANA